MAPEKRVDAKEKGKEENPAAAKAGSAGKPSSKEAKKLLAEGNLDKAGATIAAAERTAKAKAKAKKKKAESGDAMNACMVVLGTVVVLVALMGYGCANSKFCSKAYHVVTGLTVRHSAPHTLHRTL